MIGQRRHGRNWHYQTMIERRRQVRKLTMQEVKSVSGERFAKPTSIPEAMVPSQGVPAKNLVETVNTASGAFLTATTPATSALTGFHLFT